MDAMGEELLDAAAVLDAAARLADLDDGERWKLIGLLHRTVDRAAFEATLAAAKSGDRVRRLVGLDVLGQIGYRAERPFLGETLAPLIAACEDDADVDVVIAAVTALGHLHDVRGQSAVLRHVGHPDADVRFAVAFALPSVTDAETPDDDVVRALITLTRDPEAAVRDWATFGLGARLEADAAEIRAALTARLDDPDEATAEEAAAGLSRLSRFSR